jgi:hypothetical protein
MGCLKIVLVYGELSKETSDMIVNLNDGFLLNSGVQSRMLTSFAGPLLQKDCERIIAERFGKEQPQGSLVEARFKGKLNCKSLCHSIALNLQ